MLSVAMTAGYDVDCLSRAQYLAHKIGSDIARTYYGDFLSLHGYTYSN